MLNHHSLKRQIFSSFIILLLQGFIISAKCQNTNLAWVKQMGGGGDDISGSVAIDNAGNSYTSGIFSGTTDFDPGPGVYNLTSFGDFDAFIVKLDANGNFIWAKQMGGTGTDQARSITIDAGGNIYTTGWFFYTADLDPGPGIYNLTALGQYDVFIVKLDANGNFVWAKQMGGTDYDSGLAISLDAAGNVYTTGEFKSSIVDFDPGPGIYNISCFGMNDVFVSKLDPDGNFVWAKQIGGTGIDEVRNIKVDASGNAFICGEFFSDETPDFDPGPGIYSLIAQGGPDIFILKLNASGDFVWVKQLGGPSLETANAITLDNSGNIYTTGWFLTSVDFDPGPGTYTLNTAGSSGIFISKLDAAGNFVWAKQFSGSTATPQVNAGSSVTVDANGFVYTTGGFLNTVDFDPGAGTYTLNGVGPGDIFISILDASGNFFSATQISSTGTDGSNKIIVSPNNDIYLTGFFSFTADFDPCSGVYNLSSAGTYDFFVEKFNQPIVNISASATTVCSGTAVTFTANAVNTGIAPAYQWQVNGINTGTNSTTFTSSSLNNNDQVSVILTSNLSCIPPATDTSNKITITVNTAASPSVSIATASSVICTGNAVTFTANTLNGGPAPSYQWQINGINAGTNAASFTTSTLANNDVVKLILTNSTTCAAVNTATSNSITMQVNSGVVPAVTITASSNNICPGTAVSFTALPVNAGSDVSYQWKLNGTNVGGNSITYINNNILNSDKVFCIMNTTTTCSATPIFNSDTITMAVDQLPAITFSPAAAIISLGNTVQLNAVINGSYANYFWTPTTGLNNPLLLNPLASPLSSTVYKLHVSTANNCITEKDLPVTISKGLFIPNSFSPNGDGVNDIFRIPPGIAFELEYFSVYNRYGNEIFKTTEISKGWNGIYNGKRSPDGVYVYVVKGKDSKGDIFLKGTFLLIH